MKHGALLDAELLAEVYLELMGGRQPGLVLDTVAAAAQAVTARAEARPRPHPLPPRLTLEERTTHEAFVATLGAEALWLAAKG